MTEVQYLGVDEQSDKEAFKSKALAQALDNASERKRVFEERLRVKLVVKSFFPPGSRTAVAAHTGLRVGGKIYIDARTRRQRAVCRRRSSRRGPGPSRRGKQLPLRRTHLHRARERRVCRRAKAAVWRSSAASRSDAMMVAVGFIPRFDGSKPFASRSDA